MNDTPTEWTIAIIDDQPEARELIRYAIRAMFPKTQILEPQSPQWLLQHLTDQPLTAIVTRYKLFGEMNGLTFATRLRTLGFKGTILMLSNAEQIASEACAAGIDEFLSFSHWSELPMRLARLLTEKTLENGLVQTPLTLN